jgi:hypothetical protein
MTTKKYDLAVKVGEYQKDGQTKNKYQNIGAILEKEDGGRFMLLDRFFNPAGVPNPDDRSNVIVSLFEPRGYGEDLPPVSQPAATPAAQRPPAKPAAPTTPQQQPLTGSNADGFEDDFPDGIPF